MTTTEPGRAHRRGVPVARAWPLRVAALTGALAGLLAALWGCGGGGSPASPDPAARAPVRVPDDDPAAAAPPDSIDPALLLGLSSSDALTRVNAVAAAVDADSSGALLRDAFLDPALTVRLETVDELARLPSAQAAALLQPALQDGDALVREAALYSLADVDARAARRAAERAAIDPDPMVREAAREILTGLTLRP